MKITAKKPIWSTYIWTLDGTGSVIHNYADGTNSGVLRVSMAVIEPFQPYYIRKISHEDLG